MGKQTELQSRQDRNSASLRLGLQPVLGGILFIAKDQVCNMEELLGFSIVPEKQGGCFGRECP